MRNSSLYVAKADGTREVLDEVTFEMAREVFSRLDWERELETFQIAMDEGREGYVPEFGLTDDEERRLVISPVSAEAVHFLYQSPEDSCGVPVFPKDEIATLLQSYFEENDDPLQQLAAQHQPPPLPPKELYEISDPEFEATKESGMRRIDLDENLSGLRAYLGACIEQLSLPTSLETIELTDIFLSEDVRYSHVLFNYGDPATAFAIVIDHDRTCGHWILGHHFVSLAVSGYPP